MANVLPFDRQADVIAALTEGVSIRATERLTGIHRDTIMRLMGHCPKLDARASCLGQHQRWQPLDKETKREQVWLDIQSFSLLHASFSNDRETRS